MKEITKSEAGSRFDDSLADKTKLKTKRELLISHQLLYHFQFIVRRIFHCEVDSVR